MREKKKGFTLIELLATIFIISIIFGIGSYFMLNTINKSKEESNEIAYTNIKTTARIYIEENPKDVIWQQNPENTNQSYSCISIKTLISKGLLKNDILENNTIPNFVIIKKDNNENILSETLDTTGICQNNTNTIPIPTSKKYCNTLTYNGTNQTLTKDIINQNFVFTNNTQTNAGTYEVKAKLSEGYIWEDGTFTDKTITCSIKKAVPVLTLNPNGTDNSTIEKNITTELTSNINGSISIKPANKDYITATPTDNSKNIIANTPKEITITPLASRNIETTITITITPSDTKNYYSTSTIYTIGQPSKTKIPIPTASTYCNNLTYNKNTQTLVKPASTGFNFYNITGLEAGTYDVIAKLKYGYIWNDNTLTDKIITCTIKEATPTITYKTNGGTTCNPNNKTVTYNKPYGELCTTTKSNYTFEGWYTSETGGTKVTQDTIVSTIENHNLYAHWKANKVYIIYNVNGGKITNQTKDNSNTYNWTTDTNGNIFRSFNGTNTNKFTTIDYGSSTSNNGLANYNNPNYIKIDKNGYSGKNGAEWICTTGCKTNNKTFNQASVYKATDFCDTSKGDCTVTLKVNWTPNTYNVTLNNQSATKAGTAEVTATYDKAMPTITKPEKKYTVTYNANNGSVSPTSATATYTFGGYYTKTNGKGTQYYTATGTSAKNWDLTSNTTLYAKWTGGSVSLPTPTRNGYTFNGWYTAASGGTKVGTGGNSYTTTSNITLYAQWKANNYTLTYNSNGGNACNPTSKSITYNTAYGTLCTPTRSGYTFIGWYTAASGGSQVTARTTTTGNATIYAQWKSAKTVTVINGDYMVCPNDQNVPARNTCVTYQVYNTMYVNNIRINGTQVTIHIRLHMNHTSVTYSGTSPIRTLCLASGNTCVKNLATLNIGRSNWTTKGGNPINSDFTFNVNDLSPGVYRIILDGTNTKYRFRDTPYALDTIRIS